MSIVNGVCGGSQGRVFGFNLRSKQQQYKVTQEQYFPAFCLFEFPASCIEKLSFGSILLFPFAINGQHTKRLHCAGLKNALSTYTLTQNNFVQIVIDLRRFHGKGE